MLTAESTYSLVLISEWVWVLIRSEQQWKEQKPFSFRLLSFVVCSQVLAVAVSNEAASASSNLAYGQDLSWFGFHPWGMPWGGHGRWPLVPPPQPSAPARPWPCPWGTLPPMPSINWPVHPWPWAPPPKPAAALHPDSNTKAWSCFPLINFCPLVFDGISCFQSTLNILLDRFRLGSEYKNKDVMKQLGNKSSCYIFNWLIIVFIFLSLVLSSFCYICIHTHPFHHSMPETIIPDNKTRQLCC